MDNLVTISNVKENVLEFNVIINGIDTNETSVRFVIEANEMDLAFDSEKGDEENLWSVKIPPLSILETTAYPFRIDVVVDGYHFDAMKGSVNIVGSHDIYATTPENITLTPAKKKRKIEDILPKKDKIEVKKEETKKLKPAIVKKSEKIVKVVKTVSEPLKVDKIKVDAPVEPTVKPNRKFEMTPLKVKDSGELFKELNDNKKPERKPDNKIDDKIVNLMKKAKTDKEIEVKKEETKPVIKKVAKTEKKVETPKKEVKKKAKAKIKVKESKQETGAKNIAEKIIQAVTGLGVKKEKTIDDKIKSIINEDKTPKKRTARKKIEHKEPGAIKKIGKDNIIVEVDAAKDQSVKDILNESDDTKSVTTKPLDKKGETIH